MFFGSIFSPQGYFRNFPGSNFINFLTPGAFPKIYELQGQICHSVNYRDEFVGFWTSGRFMTIYKQQGLIPNVAKREVLNCSLPYFFLVYHRTCGRIMGFKVPSACGTFRAGFNSFRLKFCLNIFFFFFVFFCFQPFLFFSLSWPKIRCVQPK